MKIKTIGVIIMLVLLSASCNQEPIFYIISTETAPLPPRIAGVPTNMVVFQRVYPDIKEPVDIMYVASGRLHWYAKAPDGGGPEWDSNAYPIAQPEGKIISLAVAEGANGASRLYALCRDGSGVNAKLRYIESGWKGGEKWTDVNSDRADIQSIYAAPESQRLFAGVGRSSYDILYLDTAENKLKMLKENSSLLSGAVYYNGINYLSTRGSGIYQIADNVLTQNPTAAIRQLNDATDDERNRNPARIFMSMIKLKDNSIIAVEREGGTLYKVQNGSFARLRYTINNNNNWIATGKYATEAITLWEEIDSVSGNPTRRLLVVGIQGGLYSTTASSYTYGYVEFELKLDGSLDTAKIRRDPGNLLTVSADNDRYTTSLGKHPINNLFQTPKEIDEDIIFFASTQTAGLWSYRNIEKNGGWQWNAEN
ncbi:MAG: hypothetical protein FWF55_05685 [Treponema sp.]|nr:hypothetical protein [Treponema sp.]